MPKSEFPFDDLSSALSRAELQSSLSDKAIASARNTTASRGLDSVSGNRDAINDLTATASAVAQASVMQDVASHTALASSMLQTDRSVAKALDAITRGPFPSTAVQAAVSGTIGSTAEYGSIFGDTAASIVGKAIDPLANIGIARLSTGADLTALGQAYRELGMTSLQKRGYESPTRSVLDEIGGPASPSPPSSVTRELAHRSTKEPASRSDAPATPSQTPFVQVASVSDIGKRVREKRKAMGMTQQRFADLAGVGRRFLVELEQGKPSLEIGRVLAVCHAAGIKLGYAT